MHEVLVNRLEGLSLPRKSVVRLTDRPDMLLDVYRGRKTTTATTTTAFFNVLYTSKYLRVMELRDTEFKVRGWPVGPCRWSNLWLVLAQHGVEPALTA